MVHEIDSKCERINISLDKRSFIKFKEYADLFRIGHCTLAQVGVYMILSVIEDVELEIMDEHHKTLKDAIPRFDGWPERFTFKPIRVLFKNEKIPKEIRDEIFQRLLEQTERLKKKNGGRGET